ncbi:ANTAR domain-containing protein [Microlunatus capsulatus]|uniref:ANTAR domain-containing protein n=1 Tax=Microlunatus capsulatus TaxID=99117 RepID=A0ABS4Z4Y1_9ACTN|nr:ANTAR domain-containing protein [Microlunatus capsulatus]MBP2416101.1 hypothetical protein [Microlunatus capsulatus]
MSDLSNRYVVAVLSTFQGGPVDPGVMPTVLSSAAVEVLGVDGAGLSLVDSLRVPLGASGEEVRVAERLQTTLGEGPCLSAVETAAPLLADTAAMVERWPLFARELMARTPFRSVVSLPLAWPDRRPFLALDLYLEDATPDPALVDDPVRGDVTTVVSTLLSGAQLTQLHVEDAYAQVPWLAGESVQSRMNVWSAVGMLMAASQLSQPEGLAVLRAHAFSQGTTLDDVAHRLTSHQLPVDEVLQADG